MLRRSGGEMQPRSRKGDVQLDPVRRFTCIAYSQTGVHLDTERSATHHHAAHVEPVRRQFRLADVVVAALFAKLDLRHNPQPSSKLRRLL